MSFSTDLPPIQRPRYGGIQPAWWQPYDIVCDLVVAEGHRNKSRAAKRKARASIKRAIASKRGSTQFQRDRRRKALARSLQPTASVAEKERAF